MKYNLSENEKKVLVEIIAKNPNVNIIRFKEFPELSKNDINNSIQKLIRLGLVEFYQKAKLWCPTEKAFEIIKINRSEFRDVINIVNKKAIFQVNLNFERKIKSILGTAINNKDEELYVEGVKQAIKYYLKNKLSLITLSSAGTSYLHYMDISEEYDEILNELIPLDVCENPKKIAKECLDKLNKLTNKKK